MINSVKEVNNLLQYCFKEQISDIHIESLQEQLRIRTRKDGRLNLYKEYAKNEAIDFIPRIKIIAGMDVNKKTISDGRIQLANIHVRISIIPTFWGEKIVMRVLFPEQEFSFSTLGIPLYIEQPLLGHLHKQQGLILVTGPTGSGKTTTIYTLLKSLNRDINNIVTIEDPIEYQMDKITQVPVKKEVGFAEILRAVLRQDPDIIFVGEIRDSETAKVALRAALTGHLVVSTLHTRNTLEAISRLKDLGIEEYIIKDTMVCVISQQLYRLICTTCSGTGCKNCNHTGYAGRKGIFEYFSPTTSEYHSFEKAKQKIIQENITTPEELFFL